MTPHRPKAITVALHEPFELLERLPHDGFAWIRHGQGMIGIGVAAEFSGPTMEAAARWWQDWSSQVEIQDEDGVGQGPVAFGSFPFDPNNTEQQGRLVVPKIILGQQHGISWLTVIDGQPALPAIEPAPTEPKLEDHLDRSLPTDIWCQLVAEAAQKVRDNGLAKVVLARSLHVASACPIDPRWPFLRLTRHYPSCWSFIVDGFLGASPEMLLRRQGGLVTSRVLAGTIKRIRGNEGALSRALESSDKDLIEHQLAVSSVAEALAPYCSGMNVPDAPYVLQLPNVLHLASDVTAVAKADCTSLELAAALHPSAAVCGTPTADARAYIAQHEQLDRGRYSGPVGWMDTYGDGEWCIGLRSGQLDEDHLGIEIFAGCGIVADSVPEEELAETKAKFAPMRQALGLKH